MTSTDFRVTGWDGLATENIALPDQDPVWVTYLELFGVQPDGNGTGEVDGSIMLVLDRDTMVDIVQQFIGCLNVDSGGGNA